MKVNVWVHKSDVVNNKITKYYTHGIPQTSNWPDYVQVQISQDEFAKLEDRETGRSTENYTYPEFVNKHYKK